MLLGERLAVNDNAKQHADVDVTPQDGDEDDDTMVSHCLRIIVFAAMAPMPVVFVVAMARIIVVVVVHLIVFSVGTIYILYLYNTRYHS